MDGTAFNSRLAAVPAALTPAQAPLEGAGLGHNEKPPGFSYSVAAFLGELNAVPPMATYAGYWRY